MNREEILARVREYRVIPIIRAADPQSALARATAVVDGGLQLLEVSLVTPAALDVITQLRERYPDAAIGVGTVLDAIGVRAAAAAGASFVVSPIFSPEVIAAAVSLDLVSVPGCLTPTEMVGALAAGADLIKIFPASAWSPMDLRGVLEALPHLPTVPTGGVSAASAPEWIGAGAVAVGMGSWLTANEAPVTRARIAELRATIDSAH